MTPSKNQSITKSQLFVSKTVICMIHQYIKVAFFGRRIARKRIAAITSALRALKRQILSAHRFPPITNLSSPPRRHRSDHPNPAPQ
ncbi:hypothetical protein L596_024569 [Steinernema carpocapsae]|uniref:Uncharacterized protein n=1 Tax=Steinernema carpocapsae TaxID=34508 RepID=A0A4U5MH53_STECR|nr:hypothetical protein L596_024569 [Steinernema carpocapsae]